MRKGIFLLLSTLLLLSLCACGANTDTEPESSPAALVSTASAILSDTPDAPSATMDPERRKQVRLALDCDSHNQIQIPDPKAITEDVVEISLQTEADYDKDDLFDSEIDEVFQSKVNSRYGVDLSFAGFDADMNVSAYTVGNMTNPDSKAENCLALFVHNSPKIEEEENYFLVLDYGNGTYYKTETKFFLHGWDNWVKFEARDMTGDGTEELVVSHVYNKSVAVGVFRCDEQSHTLIPLFSTEDDFNRKDWDYLDRSWFQGHLEDDYKVVLEFPDIQYSKTVSMIEDGGYSRKELQVGSEDPYGGINFVALWKDGKLQKKKVDSDTVSLETLDHVGYSTGTTGQPQLELVRGISIGHRSEQIGDMHIYLQYDPDEDRLVLADAKYVDAKQAEKDFETFDEWKEE